MMKIDNTRFSLSALSLLLVFLGIIIGKSSKVVVVIDAFMENTIIYSSHHHHHQLRYPAAAIRKIITPLQNNGMIHNVRIRVVHALATKNDVEDDAKTIIMQSDSTMPQLTNEDKEFVSSLYYSAVKESYVVGSSDGGGGEEEEENNNLSSLENAISARLQDMSPTLLVALQMAAKTGQWGEGDDDDDEADEDDNNKNNDTNNFGMQMVHVGNALQNVLDTRLRSGRTLLTDLLNSGEIRKLDSLIGKAAREGRLDMSFFSVLSMNMQDAAMEESTISRSSNKDDAVIDVVDDSGEGNDDVVNRKNGANRSQILQHIYTRCQEELEKNVPPGMGLLNKLLRTEISSIRTNQLQYYLGPQATSITSPDGKTIELNSGTGGKALVSHGEFIDALSQSVTQIRALEKAGGTDRLSAMNLIENIRRVAMEARVVLVDSYGDDSEIVLEFQKDLQPVFRPSGSG